MDTPILTDFFYGDEAEQFAYFRIPRLLITSPRFKGLSTEAKLLYGMMLDRMGLSLKNDWHEDDGRVYIYYTVEEISEDLNCARDKSIKLLAELDESKGLGLISRKRQGQGRPTKIYVKRFTTCELPESSISRSSENRSQEVGKTDFKKSEKPTSRGRENPTSRGRENRLQEVGKSDSNNTDISKTNISQTDLSILPSLEDSTPQTTAARDGWMDGGTVRESIKQQIEYITLPYRLNPPELRQVDELVEIMVEVAMNRAETIRIGPAEYDASYVQDRFQRITCEHIVGILTTLNSELPKVRNVKGYLLATLFNSVTTLDNGTTLDFYSNFA